MVNEFYERKEKSKENPRVPFFSISQKSRDWFYGVISIGGIFVILSTFCRKWEKGWFKLLESLDTNVPAFVFTAGLLFVIGEFFMDLNQRRLERRKARHREIAEKIKWAVEGSGRNPQSFDDELEKQAFRLLEKHRPPRFSKICRRKSSEYHKMIAKEIRCIMQSKRDDISDDYDTKIEERAFRALEKNRPKSLFRFFKRKKHRE